MLIAVTIVSVRLILTLPAVAVDHPSPFTFSWGLTRGHWWRIVWVSFVTFVPLFFIAAIGGVIAKAGQVSAAAGGIGAAISAAGQILSVSIGAALASALYRAYVGRAAEEAAVAESPWG